MSKKRPGRLHTWFIRARGSPSVLFEALTFARSRLIKRTWLLIRRAPTIVSVLMVCAVLAAIIFPATNCTMGGSRRTTCINNINQLGKAETMYSGDNDEKFCLPYAVNEPFSLGDSDTTGVGASPVTPWSYLMQSYIKSTGALLCPDQAELSIVNKDAAHQMFYTGFGYNYLGLSIAGARPDPVMPRIPDYPQIAFEGVKHPEKTVLFVDAVGLSSSGVWPKALVPGNGLVDPPVPPSGKPGELLQKGVGWGSEPACYGRTTNFDYSGYGGVAFRHPALHSTCNPPSLGEAPEGFANVVFVDGHIKWLTVNQLAAGTGYTPTACTATIVNPAAYLWDPRN